MGVMACDRTGCDSIMCDTYIEVTGYICNECIREFKQYIENNDIKPKTHHDIKNLVIGFMNTLKPCGNDDEMTVDEFFEKNN